MGLSHIVIPKHKKGICFWFTSVCLSIHTFSRRSKQEVIPNKNSHSFRLKAAFLTAKETKGIRFLSLSSFSLGATSPADAAGPCCSHHIPWYFQIDTCSDKEFALSFHVQPVAACPLIKSSTLLLFNQAMDGCRQWLFLLIKVITTSSVCSYLFVGNRARTAVVPHSLLWRI